MEYLSKNIKSCYDFNSFEEILKDYLMYSTSADCIFSTECNILYNVILKLIMKNEEIYDFDYAQNID